MYDDIMNKKEWTFERGGKISSERYLCETDAFNAGCDDFYLECFALKMPDQRGSLLTVKIGPSGEVTQKRKHTIYYYSEGL